MRARVQKTKIGAGGADSTDLSALFNNVLMGDLVDLQLAWPKYLRICKHITAYRELHGRLASCPLLERAELADARPSVAAHGAAFDALYDLYCKFDLSDYDQAWDMIERRQHEEFHAKYDELKKSPLIKALFRSAAQIIDYKAEFSDMGRSPQARLGFVLSMPGIDWAPFPHAFNYGRAMLVQGIGKNTYAWLAAYLYDYHTLVMALWKTIQEPEVDVEKFSGVINEMADKLQTIPEISRCKGALAVIRSSIGLFKENFGSYYGNFLDTNDSSSIMHEFIIDVTEANGKNNPELTRQFRTIINFFRKQTELRATNDPQLQKAMATLNRVIDRTEEATNAKLGTAVRREAVENAAAAAAPARAVRAAASAPDPTASARAAAAAMSAEDLAAYIDDDAPVSKKLHGAKK